MNDDNVVDVDFRTVPDAPVDVGEQLPSEPLSDEERLLDLIGPIRKQILKCETRKDILLMASAMLQHAKDLMILELGIDATKIVFDNLKFEDPVNDKEDI